MGLARKARGARHPRRLDREGRKLPINPSGGLKSKGHPVGATGVSMHVLGSMQVTGQAGDMQIPNAALAGIMNMAAPRWPISSASSNPSAADEHGGTLFCRP